MMFLLFICLWTARVFANSRAALVADCSWQHKCVGLAMLKCEGEWEAVADVAASVLGSSLLGTLSSLVTELLRKANCS